MIIDFLPKVCGRLSRGPQPGLLQELTPARNPQPHCVKDNSLVHAPERATELPGRFKRSLSARALTESGVVLAVWRSGAQSGGLDRGEAGRARAQRIDDAAHVVERRERLLVGRVGALRGVDVQAARARVEDAVEALVENHLRELVLDLGQRQLHELRDVARLHLGVLGVGC